MVSPTRNDFRFVWPLNRPAAISETTNKPGSVPRLVPSYNHQISPDKQDRTLLVLILALAPAQHNLCILTAMAATTTTQLTFFPLVLRLSDPRRHHSCKFLSVPTQSSSALALRVTTTTALGSDMLGDFGARDPFPAELESGFGEKVLGNVDTEHKILIPKLSALSLAEQDCSPASPFQTPMSADDAKKLLKKVVGWRLLEEEGGLKLQCLWKLRDFKCGVELINRIYKVTEAAGHFPNLHLEQPNQVRAELWTSSIGGLSMNDFIVAAKLDQIRTSDLAPRKRIWA